VYNKADQKDRSPTDVDKEGIAALIPFYSLCIFLRHRLAVDPVQTGIAKYFFRNLKQLGCDDQFFIDSFGQLDSKNFISRWGLVDLKQEICKDLSCSPDKLGSLSYTFENKQIFGSYGVLPGFFIRPNCIRADGADHLFVADTNNSRIQKFDPDGNFLSCFGSYGTSEHQLNLITHILPYDKGLVLLNKNNRTLQFFSGEGEFFQSIPFQQISDGANIVAIGSHPEFPVFALDFSKRVFGLDLNGNVLKTQSLTVDRWDTPRSVLSGENGRVYVGMNGEIVLFDEEGKVLSLASRVNKGDGLFGDLSLISDLVWYKNYILCTDYINGQLLVLDPELRLITSFGGLGMGQGEFWGLSSVAVIQDYLYLLDLMNNRIQKIRISL